MSCQQQVTQPITTTTASSETTTEYQDPYVFTETVPTTPPILFNAQKSRTRVLIDTTQATKTTTPTPNAPTIATQQTTPTALTHIVTTAVANKQRATPTAATANANKFKFQQKLPLSPLNGNNTQKTHTPTTLAAATGQNGSAAAAAAAAAMAKVTTPSIVKTTITQSQNQLQQQQQQLKKALNVCIVRPQQQQLPPTARHQQQQNLKAQQQQRKQASSPPPLLQHTPSLWQTPLLLDTATAVVSPPTSPASLPSPPVAGTLTTTSSPSPSAATALVSPLISAAASTLPPSNFHHNTMAQHLQKVECLKKPKKTLANNESSIGSTTTEKQQPAAMLKPQQQQSQRREVGAKTVVVQPTSILLHPNPNQQHHQQHPAQMLKPNVATSSAPPPLQAIQAVAVPQHSDNDLNEIPVNVIFRKPQSTDILHSQLGGCNVSMTAVGHSDNSKAPATSITSLVSTVNKKGLTPAKSKNVRTLQTTNMHSKSKSNAVVTEATPSLLPAPHVLRDIVFTHTGTGELAASKQTSPHTLPAHTTPTQKHYRSTATVINKQQQQQKNMSSMAKFSTPQLPIQAPQQSYKYDNVSLTQFASKTISDTQSQCVNAAAVKAANTMNMGASKNMSKRKMTATPIATNTAAAAPHTALSLPYLKKRSRKIGPLYSQSDNEMFLQCTTTTAKSGSSNVIGRRNSHAVAVVKLSAAEIEADTTLLASSTVLPYCIQKHWLYITREIQLVGGVCGVGTQAAAAATKKGVGALLSSASERETRITQRKTILRRQALQLLATHSLQKLPLQAARRRLMCVDRLLRKYERHGNNEIIAHKKCNYADCAKTVLEMATQCEDHIVDNISQHIFLPCTAKFADNTQCRIPVFDIIHDLPLCAEHARKRDAAYNRGVYVQQRSQTNNNKLVSAVVASTLNKTSVDSGDTGDLLLQLQQIQQQHKQQQQQQLYNNAAMSKIKKSTNIKVNSTRKRKAPSTTGPNAAVRPLKRPKKTTSPVVATAAAATVAPTQLTSAVLQRKSSTTSLESIASNSQSSNSQPHYISSNMNMQGGGQAKIAMPALAPLSGRNMPVVSSTVSPTSVPPKHTLSFGFINNNDGGGNIVQATNDVISQDLKPHEISQLVAQFSVAVNSNNNRNNNNNYNSNTNENSNTLNTYSNNSISNSYNFFIGTNCDSNFTSALGSTSSLPSSTEELFRQELLSVCENSSVYASSEDTGLGGLSETELMVGPNDADDIPLGDTRLLEEHDLANVLSALPEDAFNELFTAVHQEEREEVERALELADKHLKSLQQTIGTDIDFLGDFPDDDEILADTNAIVSSVMRSPDATSGIDTSTLFIDSGSNSVGGGVSINTSNLTDIRGLVQT